MWKKICTQIDDCRVWYKITCQRGRILATDPEAWRRYAGPPPFASPETFFTCNGAVPPVRIAESRA